MENRNYNSFNSEIAYVLVIQALDKVIRKEITHEEMNEIMSDMLDKEYDFLHASGTFVNKKTIYFLEFQPILNNKNTEDK